MPHCVPCCPSLRTPCRCVNCLCGVSNVVDNPEFLRDRLALCTSGLGTSRVVDDVRITYSQPTLRLPCGFCLCACLDVGNVPEFLRDRLALCTSGLGISRTVADGWTAYSQRMLGGRCQVLARPVLCMSPRSGYLHFEVGTAGAVLARPVLVVSPRSGHTLCCWGRDPATGAQLVRLQQFL